MRRNTTITSIDLVDVDTAKVACAFPNIEFNVSPDDLDSALTFRNAMARETKRLPHGPLWEGDYRTKGQQELHWNNAITKAFGTMDEVTDARWNAALKAECEKRGIV